MSAPTGSVVPLAAGATLHPLVLPAQADAAEGQDFREFAEMRNRLYLALTGRRDENLTARELLPILRSTPDELTYSWSIQRAGKMIGRAGIEIPLEDGAKVAFAFIELFPEAWGAGIGSAVLPHLEGVALKHDRVVLQGWAEHPRADEPTLTPPTGFGSIPKDHTARFLLRQGFSLEQVVRGSVLDLSGDTLPRVAALLGEAEHASSAYRIVQWLTPTPAQYREGYAWMKSRMVTDAPAAGLSFDEETWDAARVARMDQDRADGGFLFQVTAAQHIETGELCAFNELRLASDATSTHQHDTLVLSDHRGHRLGMRVKCAALLSWEEVAPRSLRVLTYNAEENRPMLSINEAIGFTPFAYEGAWRKELPQPDSYES